ncbi:uncharacterized protein LOC115572110 isoform X2 [Sparus aurata]|uniref:uncharacterized protein LOC115572110 isoform X2 n=1 Tax=Sparus aurata TaxID=8175 RepID=UPI0011C0EE48|nr:uncharacterized protein LOC115572110 isoform X2 [Sparus aurata]
MGAMWAFFICVLTVWLAKGSCLPVGGTNKRNEHVPQRKMEVQLETNDVEAESSVSHMTPVQLKTEKDVPVGTAVDSSTYTFTFSGTFPAGGSASTSSRISNTPSATDNGGGSLFSDRFPGTFIPGIFIPGIFNGGISNGGGVFASNGGAFASPGNAGVFAGPGIGGIVAGNGGSNFLHAGLSNFEAGRASSYNNGGSSSEADGHGSHDAANGSGIIASNNSIFADPLHKGSLPEAGGRGHLKVGQKLQNKAKAESS